MLAAPSPSPGRSSQERNTLIVVAIAVAAIAVVLSVTLLTAFFAFVTSWPSPPPQNPNRFQASLYNNNAGYIAGLDMIHLAGPAVPGDATVFVKSASDPNQCFSRAGVNVSAGISTPTWIVGEAWNGSFGLFPGCPAGTYDSALHDNITVFLVSSEELLFSAIIPT